MKTTKRPDMLGNTYARGKPAWNRGKVLNPNKLPIKEYLRNYCLTPNGIYAHIKQGANRRGIKLEMIQKDFAMWYEKVDKNCYYCGRTVEEIRNDSKEGYNFKQRLSVDRKNSEIGYTQDNIILSCMRCNAIKSNYFNEEEMIEIGKVIKSFNLDKT